MMMNLSSPHSVYVNGLDYMIRVFRTKLQRSADGRIEDLCTILQ